MYSYFSSRAPSPRSQADALSSESLCPQPFSLRDVVLHDRYRILKPLGEGGFGKTFLARDEQFIHFFCVVKQLSLPVQTNHHQPVSELFLQEAQYLAALGEHPQMPRLLDVFEQDGQLFIVQEWIDGWTLEQELADGVPFDEVEVWQLLRDLLPVLQYLHDRQIIHRDIKPTNIIRRRHADATLGEKPCQLVLVDFGAAKQIGSVQSVSTGTLIGSAEYAAPEQIRGQAVFVSDLYSLGVTCLHLLTQMSPFDLYDIGEATWKWQAYLKQPISPSLKQILCTLLQPATRRYRSAAEVLTVVDEVCIQMCIQDHQALPQAGAAIAPIDSAKIEPPFLTSQCATNDFSSAAIAAINVVRMTRSISATVYSPQTQRWYDLTPDTMTTDAAFNVALFSDSYLADATTNPHQRAHRSPLAHRSAHSRQTPVGWRLFAVGMGTAVASVAMTCLWVCVSIIFLALTVPPQSSATPSKADLTEVIR